MLVLLGPELVGLELALLVRVGLDELVEHALQHDGVALALMLVVLGLALEQVAHSAREAVEHG
eukprot:1870885-Alexandrium_andersonii.AAC.1